MSNKIVLCDCDNVHETVKDIKFEWCMQVLEAAGVDIVSLNTNDISAILNSLNQHSIEVITGKNGIVDIHKVSVVNDRNNNQVNDLPSKSNLIAQWKEPSYVKIFKNKEAYYEIHLNEWSIYNIRN